jgi:hypothetical protein
LKLEEKNKNPWIIITKLRQAKTCWNSHIFKTVCHTEQNMANSSRQFEETDFEETEILLFCFFICFF